MELTEQAKEKRREYSRNYYRLNKEKIKENQRRYWERKLSNKTIKDF